MILIFRSAVSCPTVRFWEITSGSSYCEKVDDGRCVTDGDGEYGNDENCEVKALKPLVMSAEQYDVEQTHDFITVNGEEYHNTGPNQVTMRTGDKWTWKSDSDTTRDGFKICGGY